MDYEVHTALWEDLKEGWVWVKDPNLREGLQDRRRIVRIVDKEGGASKKIYCEALYADEFYIDRFNKKARNPIGPNKNYLIFISGWYRYPLGIKLEDLGHSKNLTIEVGEFPRSLWWQLQAVLQHPQTIVLLAIVLAIISVGVGFIGLGLGIIGIKKLKLLGMLLGSFFSIFGIFLITVGTVSLFKRATCRVVQPQ